MKVVPLEGVTVEMNPSKPVRIAVLHFGCTAPFKTLKGSDGPPAGRMQKGGFSVFQMLNRVIVSSSPSFSLFDTALMK